MPAGRLPRLGDEVVSKDGQPTRLTTMDGVEGGWVVPPSMSAQVIGLNVAGNLLLLRNSAGAECARGVEYVRFIDGLACLPAPTGTIAGEQLWFFNPAGRADVMESVQSWRKAGEIYNGDALTCDGRLGPERSGHDGRAHKMLPISYPARGAVDSESVYRVHPDAAAGARLYRVDLPHYRAGIGMSWLQYDKPTGESAVYVREVAPGGVCARAGVPTGRLIAVGGQVVRTTDDMEAAVKAAQTNVTPMLLAIAPDSALEEELALEKVFGRKLTRDPLPRQCTLRLHSASQAGIRHSCVVGDAARRSRRVVVTGARAGSAAARAGLPRGVIRSIDGSPIQGGADLAAALQRAEMRAREKALRENPRGGPHVREVDVSIVIVEHSNPTVVDLGPVDGPWPSRPRTADSDRDFFGRAELLETGAI